MNSRTGHIELGGEHKSGIGGVDLGKIVRVQQRFTNAAPAWMLLLAFALVLTPSKSAAWTTPPRITDPMDAWATYINNQLPQAVPQQTITLGTFEASQTSSSKLLWKTSVGSYFCAPGNGGVVALNPPICFALNSYDMVYQIAIERPANYDVQVVLTAPTVNGGTEQINGTIQDSTPTTTPAGVLVRPSFSAPGAGARPIPPPGGNGQPPGSGSTSGSGTPSSQNGIAVLSFHPHVLGEQHIQFFHAGKPLNCDFDGKALPCYFTIKASLQPQLGAFVVPYLPVTVIYQPQGCGACASTPAMCGSNADYVVGSTVGTTLSWDYSRTSGTVATQNSSDYFNGYSAFLNLLSLLKTADAGTLSTVSQALGAVQSVWNTQKITTSQTGTGYSESKSWAISFKDEFRTDICSKEDLFVYLRNVLFVYFVLPRDPRTGNITPSPYGIPTVVITAVHYDEPIVPLSTSQVQAQLPPAVAQQLLALDLQLNPNQLNLAIRAARPSAPPASSKNAGQSQSASSAGPQPINGPLTGRLSYVAPQACPTTFSHPVSEDTIQFSQSSVYQIQTTSTTTNVTGFLASILGQAGQTIQSVTYKANNATWHQEETGSGLSLECPEYAPLDALTMQVYFDTMLGTLLAVPAGPYQPQGGAAAPSSASSEGLQGTLQDAQGRPVANQHVLLTIAGQRYGTLTDKQGKFSFLSHSPILPTGTGTLTVASRRFPVTYKSGGLTTLSLKTTGVITASSPLKQSVSPAAVRMPATAFPTTVPAASPDRSTARAAAPQSVITAIDSRTAVITARVSATGQTFQFTLANPALVSRLQLGGGVYANFSTRQVSLDGRTVAGAIVAIAPGTAGSGLRRP